jgi:F-type H+-transporting ATPase subunit b
MNLQLDVLVTQIIGFLIVLWVLRKFAWGPILGNLEVRRKRIADNVAGAELMRKEAEQVKAKVEDELKGIEAQARARIQAAMAEGQKAAEEIRAGARFEAQQLRDKAKADIRMEYEKARASLHKEVVHLALGAAEKLIQEEMDDERHRKLVDRFVSELPGMKTS